LKFTRLRLSGFKSFIDPTELFVEPGLTGVIGPNGCGKSNLLEALRWVMGENRPTSMRGSGMEDVIFNGSATRPMRNNAEVTLIIDNADRSAPAPYNEMETIEVSRRIEREVGSIYRINGRDVRQRDVQIFFADASTGSASPALVRQGQISVLINQKPLARRAILEEAAGVAGLHQRRHEAELRLKAAETNMARLDDVIAEVETQLQGLRRQARQAARYRNLSGYIRKAEALVFLLRWQSAQGVSESANTALEGVAKVVGERTARAAEASRAQADAASALPPLRDAEAAKGAALQRLIHEREALDTEEARAREEAQRMRQRIGQSEQDLARERGLEQDAQTALAALAEESRALSEAATNAEAELAGAEDRGRELAEALGEHERQFERLTAEFAELNAKRTSYERARDEAAREIKRLSDALAELQPRLEAADGERANAPDIRSAEEAAERARGTIGEMQTLANAAAVTKAEKDAAEAQAREPLDEAERRVQKLSAEANALTELLRPRGSDLWPPLIDSVRVTPGYEAALAATLGDDLSAPLDEAAPEYWRDLGNLDGAGLPQGATPLAQFVNGPAALARRLGYTGVVERAQGAALQTQLRPGQRLVTKEGDLWRWDGFASSSEAPSQAVIKLEQRNRLEAIERSLASAKAERAEIFAKYSAAREDASAAEDALREAERNLRASEAGLMGAQETATRVARAVAERMSRLASLEAEQRRLSETLETAQNAERSATNELAQLPDSAALAAALNGARAVTVEARAASAEAAGASDALKRAAAARSARLAVIAEEANRWAAREQSASQQMASLAERITRMQTDLTTLDALPEEIAAKRGKLLDAVATAEAARKEAADARAEAERLLAEADRIARAADTALSQAREERAAAEARAESALMRLNELSARIRDELDSSPEELPERAELKDNAEPLPLDQAEEKVEKLKREREQLGGVNLRAEEETAEHEQRLATLQADRADLDGAIQRLRKGIQNLNKEGRERLVASFEKVNANFEKLFKELFQGGEARLTFTESEDPLEAGLEILARPPGKKLATLSLLSGGEQALTAIALIFAVFLVNPAPICVMDEVDAPLDDANVDRFCRLLDEMTRLSDTRFLIITHHALTMSRMDRLFGVTMAERGVSQLVSVTLADAERVIAAE
jgi:chromosome segregation protein